MADKINTTLSIDIEVKKEFQLACLKNETTMSEAIESMMINFIRLAKQMENEKIARKKELENISLENE